MGKEFPLEVGTPHETRVGGSATCFQQEIFLSPSEKNQMRFLLYLLGTLPYGKDLASTLQLLIEHWSRWLPRLPDRKQAHLLVFEPRQVIDGSPCTAPMLLEPLPE